jgi:hypothetical protein
MFSYQTTDARTVLIDTLERTSSRTLRTPSVRRLTESLTRSSESSEFLTRMRLLAERRQEVESLARLQDNWNSYGSPAPTPASISSAKGTLSLLQRVLLVPSKVLPSAEGGVALTFLSETRNRAVIESLNNGESFILMYDLDGNNETVDWPHDEVEVQEKLDRLGKHLRGMSLAFA